MTGVAAPLSASVRLRTVLRPWHDALEATPFARALLSRSLPLDRYLGQLTAYRRILAALEEELGRGTAPAVSAVWEGDLAKLPYIEADLSHLAGLGALTADPAPAVTSAPAAASAATATAVASATSAFVADIRRTAAAAPLGLLGFLYVLEGSTLGALHLLPLVRDTFALTSGSDGVAYYSSGDRERWRRFLARLDSAVTAPGAQDRVLAAAGRAYRHTAAVTGALSAGLLPGDGAHTSSHTPL